jgi:hypothetical protein
MSANDQEAALVREGQRIAAQLNDAIYAARTMALRVSALGTGRITDYLTGLSADAPCTTAEWNQGLSAMSDLYSYVDTQQIDRKLEKIR